MSKYDDQWDRRFAASAKVNSGVKDHIGDVPVTLVGDMRAKYVGDLIRSTKGKIFSVDFVKRSDGSVRRMVCRRGVKKNLTGKGPAYNAASKNLITVWDMQKNDYRNINLETVTSMRFQGKEIKI